VGGGAAAWLLVLLHWMLANWGCACWDMGLKKKVPCFLFLCSFACLLLPIATHKGLQLATAASRRFQDHHHHFHPPPARAAPALAPARACFKAEMLTIKIWSQINKGLLSYSAALPLPWHLNESQVCADYRPHRQLAEMKVAGPCMSFTLTQLPNAWLIPFAFASILEQQLH
jgi:hypothetical protein